MVPAKQENEPPFMLQSGTKQDKSLYLFFMIDFYYLL